MEELQRLIKIEEELNEIRNDLRDLNILTRVNNLLLSKFILQVSNLTKDYNLPKRVTFFKFELLESDYKELVNEFGKEETDRALYRLDRLLIQNKQNCPNNIRQYIAKKIMKRKHNENKSNQ